MYQNIESTSYSKLISIWMTPCKILIREVKNIFSHPEYGGQVCLVALVWLVTGNLWLWSFLLVSGKMEYCTWWLSTTVTTTSPQDCGVSTYMYHLEHYYLLPLSRNVSFSEVFYWIQVKNETLTHLKPAALTWIALKFIGLFILISFSFTVMIPVCLVCVAESYNRTRKMHVQNSIQRLHTLWHTRFGAPGHVLDMRKSLVI